MSADDDADERNAQILEGLRRGIYRSPAAPQGPIEPNNVYPSNWAVPNTRTRRENR
ncbi:hypothetical protein [Nocardia salmonicida]|uniref:hypothetical protein n=1 Tax=Nocardia salmonicida TaxID=53431 RepID=UPI00362D3ED0